MTENIFFSLFSFLSYMCFCCYLFILFIYLRDLFESDISFYSYIGSWHAADA